MFMLPVSYLVNYGTIFGHYLTALYSSTNPLSRDFFFTGSHAGVSLISTASEASGILWTACPDSHVTKCAFLTVPLDYSNLADGDTVSIFLRKFPANVSAGNRLGTILTNPGGPGASGSSFVALAGEDMSILLDGRYDIIGFDPRGVNLTGPWTACFRTEVESLMLEYQLDIVGALRANSTLGHDYQLANRINAIQKAHNAACILNGNRKILESLGTVSVAQDMVKIIEALGEDGINYWGYSYGTILGATFASMRPDLVKRMVLDGVSDAESYFSDVWKWRKGSMDDTAKTLAGFFSTCAKAGPEHCAFAVPQGSSNTTQTATDLQKRIDAIFARLEKQPMVVGSSTAGPWPGMFTASDLQKWLLYQLYVPGGWAKAIQGLASIENGDASNLYGQVYSRYANTVAEPYDQNEFHRPMQRYLGTKESFTPIVCSDASAANISVAAYTSFLRELGRYNLVSGQWARIIGGCNGWSFRAKQRYNGPWTVEKGLNQTRFPILFMSLDADPVTPLSSAAKMAKGFGNKSATLLVQQGLGHTTSAHPSLCTYKHVHDYFINGTVPPNGTLCTPEPGFIYPNSSGRDKRELLEQEVYMIEALGRLGRARAKFNPDI